VTGPETIGNRQLAALARDLAAGAPGGSLDRKAAGCCAVALGETKTVAAARKVLAAVEMVDVRDAANELLDRLAARDQGNP
jgi:hypothetical protein